MQGFLVGGLSLIDLPLNLATAIKGFEHIRGKLALVLAVPFAVLTYALIWMVWLFDLQPTDQYAQQIARMILPIAPPEMLMLAGYVGLSLTLLPSLVELFGGQLAARGIHMASWLMLACLAFDALSDMPRVNEFCRVFLPLIESNFGQGAWIVYQLFRVLWLAMATVGFELLLFIFGTLTVQLLLQSVARPMSEARERAR